MGFSDLLPGLDAAVGGHVADPAVLRPQSGGDAYAVDVIFERPSAAVDFGNSSGAQEQPTIEVARSQVASLRSGDVFAPGEAADGSPTLEGTNWRVCGKATRSGDGRWWIAQVEPVLTS